MYYIRFTTDIYRDLENGKSKDFRNGRNLEGLCAWKVSGDLHEYSTESEILEAAKETAEMIARNTYGGYDSSSEYAVLKAEYCPGYTNDGSLIKNAEVISIESL